MRSISQVYAKPLRNIVYLRHTVPGSLSHTASTCGLGSSSVEGGETIVPPALRSAPRSTSLSDRGVCGGPKLTSLSFGTNRLCKA